MEEFTLLTDALYEGVFSCRSEGEVKGERAVPGLRLTLFNPGTTGITGRSQEWALRW
jgi:hypothetical protein